VADEEYTIGMVVEGEGEVASAAAAVDSLEASIDAAQLAADDAAAAFDTAAGSIAKMMGKSEGKGASDLSGSLKSLKIPTDAIGSSAAGAGLKFNELGESFGKLGGPIGNLGRVIFGGADAFKKLHTNLGSAGPLLGALTIGATVAAAAVALVVVAALAAAAALGALAAKLVETTITMADAANKASVMREALAGSASKAAELTSTISRVASSVPLASSEVAKLGEKLYKSGKRGRELEEALFAASYEAAGLGKNPGPDLIARRMGNLDTIGSRLKDHIASIFAGPATTRATERFGMALSGLTERFGENRAEGFALQSLMGAIVTPLINGLTALVPLAVSVFRTLVMLALDVAIAVVQARNAVIKMIPPETQAAIVAFASSEGALQAATWAVIAVLGWFVVIAGTLTAALVLIGAVLVGALTLALGIVLLPFVLLGAAIALVVVGVLGMYSAITAAISWLGELGGAGVAAASGLIDGLVGGIRAGVGAVADAMRALASSAIGALKSALKIASPSKVFERFGAFTGEGFALGVEAEAPAAASALETLTAMPDAGAASSGAQRAGERAGASGGGAGVSLSNVSFAFYGVEGAEGAESRFREALVLALEGATLQVGA